MAIRLYMNVPDTLHLNTSSGPWATDDSMLQKEKWLKTIEQAKSHMDLFGWKKKMNMLNMTHSSEEVVIMKQVNSLDSARLKIFCFKFAL